MIAAPIITGPVKAVSSKSPNPAAGSNPTDATEVTVTAPDGTIAGPPIAPGSNATNPTGEPILTPKLRGETVNGSLAAGATTSYPFAGVQVRVVASSGPVLVRAKGQPWITLWPGMLYQVDASNPFNLVEVQNPSAIGPVAFALFIGYGWIDDNRATPNFQIKPVIVCQSGTAGAATLNIADLSGKQITDVNGGIWYALQRVSVLITGSLATTTITVSNAAGTVQFANQLAAANPFPIAATGALLAVASAGVAYSLEIYLAVPAQIAG